MNKACSQFVQRTFSLGVALWVLVLAVASGPVHADLQILITKGVSDPIPIAIVPFAHSAPPEGPFDVAAVVQHDLDGSGRFKTMQRGSMRAMPSQANEVQAAEWKAAGNDYVVVGKVSSAAAGQIDVQCELVNAQTGDTVAGQHFIASAGSVRNASHQISDFIYEKILGVRGAFATRIAYISVQGQPPAQHYQLIVADADGENPKVILDSMQPIMSPAWSPDGQWLAYVSFENKVSAIYVQTIRTGERRLVSARAGVNGAPAFSPDGKHLALTLSGSNGNLDIWLLDLQTQGLTRLESRRSQHLFHLRSGRRSADLPARPHPAHARRARELRIGVQRARARLARWQTYCFRDPRGQRLSNRCAGPGFRHRERVDPWQPG
jgi:TolB protein